MGNRSVPAFFTTFKLQRRYEDDFDEIWKFNQ